MKFTESQWGAIVLLTPYLMLNTKVR